MTSRDADRWGGAHGHLYDAFVKCARCRFFAKDPAVVAAHEAVCTGQSPRAWCLGCRFDGRSWDDVRAHYARKECPDELGAIVYPLLAMDYTF